MTDFSPLIAVILVVLLASAAIAIASRRPRRGSVEALRSVPLRPNRRR